MLVFSAILPHSAILLPNVGKENLKKFKKTTEALEKIKRDFEAAKADTVIVIASHAGTKPNFALYINDKYQSNFETLGDFATKLEMQPNFPMLAHLRKLVRLKGFPLATKANNALDYDFTVPLFCLNAANKAKIVPFETADLPLKTNFECGSTIGEYILKSKERIAVIASANLSHNPEADSSGALSAMGQEFDEKIQKILTTNNAAGLMMLDETQLKEAKECGSKSISMLFGIMQQSGFTTEIYSYEAPLGISLIVTNFKLSV